MAERFGGRFSPGSGPLPGAPVTRAPAPAKPPRHRLEGRPFWLVLCGAPLLFTGFGDGPAQLATDLAAFAAIALSAWMTREGLRAEAAYDARRTARRPAIPRKALGAGLLALGVGLAAYPPENGLVGTVILAALAAALDLLAFGLDPTRNKGMEGIDPFQQDRVARVIDEAERHLAAMKDAITRTNDRRLLARVDMFAATARELFHAVETDPRDLTAARRYLGVYLMGARDATAKFADHWAATRDASARSDYEAWLSDLEANFTARTQSLIDGGRDDLEVEIEVLRDRLAREGVVAREIMDQTGK